MEKGREIEVKSIDDYIALVKRNRKQEREAFMQIPNLGDDKHKVIVRERFTKLAEYLSVEYGA